MPHIIFTLQFHPCEERPDGDFERRKSGIDQWVRTVRPTALKREQRLNYLNKNIGLLKVLIFIIYQKEPEHDKDVYSSLLEYDMSRPLSQHQFYV